MGTCQECIGKDHIVTKACIFSGTQLQLYINATDAEYCSCSIYTADVPILTKKGNSGQWGSKKRTKKCSACIIDVEQSEAEQFGTEPALSKEELKDSYIKIKVGFQTG